MNGHLHGVVFTEWNAIQDRTPGPDAGKRLTVTGVGEAPATGYTATLTYREPQGVGFPFDLLLGLTVHEPVAGGATVLTRIEVEYVGSTGYDHDTVTILDEDGGRVVTITVGALAS